MEGDLNLGRVVQNIMESLSEAISQLILFVIAMQESNAQIPSHIPQAAEGVTSASNTLADVASSLAEEEYDGYPDIQIPIIEAAKDVRTSGERLIAATNNLKTSSDRAEGWSRLLDACRVISAQTCYILQLVYGAELKRLLFAADAAKDLAGKTQAAMAAKDPQKFADQVSELAGMADALATSLDEKIKEEESPLRKEEMRKAADQLKVYSDELPKLANNILKNPTDPKPYVPFDNKVKDFNKILDNIAAPLKEKLKLLPDKPPTINPTGIPPTRKTDPPPTKQGPPFSSQAASAPPPRNPPPPSRDPPPPFTFPPQAIKKAKDDIKNMIKAAETRDPPGFAASAQEVANDITPVIDGLENQARSTHDPERAQQIQRVADNLKKYTPKAIATGAQALKDAKPNVPELSKVAQQLDTLVDFAGHISKPTPEIEVAAIAKGLLQELPKLESAAGKGNQKELEEHAKKINDLLPYLRQPTKDLVGRHTNPKVKEKLTNALKNVDQAIPESILHAKATAKSPNDIPTKNKLAKSLGVAEEALRDLIDGAGTEILSSLKKQNDDVASLDVLANLEEPKQVAHVEKAIVHRQPQIAERAIAQGLAAGDAPTTADIKKAVNVLDKLLPEQVKVAQEVVNKPGADGPRKNLKKNTEEMGKVLDNIVADVEKLPPVSSVKKPEAPLASAPIPIQELIDAIQAAKDPKGEQNLQKVLDTIGPALEKWLAEQPEKTEEELAEGNIADLGSALIDAMDKLAAAAPHAKDIKDIEPLLKEVPKKAKDFIDAVRPFVEKFVEDEEEKKLLQDALDDLAALIPDLMTTAGDVAKNPRDPRARKKLDDLNNAANKNVNFVIKKINRPPEEKQADAIRKFPKGVKKILDAIDNPDELKGALDRLKKVLRDLNPPKGDNSPNYLSGRNIADAIAELEKALAEKNKKVGDNSPAIKKPFQDAKNFFQNVLNDPKQQPKVDPKADVVAKVKEIGNLLDRLEAAAAAPNSDPKKLQNLAKAIGSKLDPLIKAAKKEAQEIKDPETRKKVEAALRNLENDIPRVLDDVKTVVQNPTPENKEKLQDVIQQARPPLDDIVEAFSPDPVADNANKEKQQAAKLAKAAKAGDPKGAEEALKALKDLNAKFTRGAKEKAARAPPKIKDHIEQKIKDLDEKIKQLEPEVLAFAKKPNDAPAREHIAELARGIAGPIDSVIQDLEFAPKALENETQDFVKQIVASIRHKNVKKIDPSHLIKISKHLAGLLSNMVAKTGDDLRNNSSDLSDRARAALELEKLLSSLETDANKSNASAVPSQSIDQLLATLNIKQSTTGQQTVLSQQISSVVKDIKFKTQANGSIEGTPLHAISQSLAADLQKFADADSGNSRSELIVLGRAISANIIRLADELKRLAGACSDPTMQDKLLLNSQVLRNYATQLKIMASVRAASSKTGQDTSSDQLVVLTQNLAAVIGDATNAVSIMKQTKTGRV